MSTSTTTSTAIRKIRPTRTAKTPRTRRTERFTDAEIPRLQRPRRRKSAGDLLKSSGVAPNVEITRNDNNSPIEWVHKRAGDTDIFFLSNQENIIDHGVSLEIDVINVWANRIIGDMALPEAERVTWTSLSDTIAAFKADQKLVPSGLYGPVTLCVEKR